MSYKDLSLRERHAIIRAGVANGIRSLSEIAARYDAFTDPVKHPDYDIEAYVRENPNDIFTHEGHFDDKYKKPNHPTFSEESIYATPSTPGGRWQGNTYEPSDYVLNKQGGWNNFLEGFYKQEQGTGAVPVFEGGVMLPEVTVTPQYKDGGSIHIKPSKRGTFTAAATKHSKSVQAFASQVLAHKENYSPAMVKKANFARNAAHWHEGESDTQYLRTEQPKVVQPSTGETADTSWYQWWFANRQKQLQQNIETVKKNERARYPYLYLKSYPNSEEDTKRMLQALGETNEYSGHSGMMEDSIGNALARNLLKHQIADYTPDIPDDRVASYLSFLQDGVHLPAYNAILYPGRGEPPSSTTVTHERAHALDALFPIEAIRYFTTSGDVSPERYNTWYKRLFTPSHPKSPLGIFPTSGKKDSYLDDPNEVYSRLMEFRQLVGANPNYTWTKEDLKKYENALEACRLRRYSDDDLLKLLNEIAQNNSDFQKSDDVYLAALGGNLKSTGGPLYPFSFSKQPLPAVRYADGGQVVRDWDKTLTGQLINHVENADSIGWDPTKRIWKHPIQRGYDPNQMGMGVDKNKTEGYADVVKIDKKGEEYLTEMDERKLRHQAIEKANASANERYKYAQKVTGNEKGTISKVKDAAVVSAIYNLGGTYVANGLFEDKDFMESLFSGTDKEVVDRINQEYKKKKRNDRVNKTNSFLGT